MQLNLIHLFQYSPFSILADKASSGSNKNHHGDSCNKVPMA